jgi:GT2 family glycosyltransferase
MIHDAGFAGGDSRICASGMQTCPAAASVASPETPSCSLAAHEAPSRGFSDFSSNRYVMNLFLVDDGSTDGTTEAVLEAWPGATVMKGNGSLYWCGGMRVAWAVAAKTAPDFFLLLNDDTLLFPNALSDLLTLAPTPDSQCIAVGAIRDPESGMWAYGGSDCERPFDPHSGGPRDCRSLNANCALVPRAVFREIGMFDRVYTHSMGDHDYGYAATRAGVPIRETASFVGECSKNPTSGTWLDTSLPIASRLSKLFSVKGLPPREWWHYCRKNVKGVWLAIFFSPYLKTLIGR